MSRATISAQARRDILGIGRYTKTTWGLQQADRYLSQLEDAFQLLAQNPSLGRPCKSIALELRRFEVGKHVVFYRKRAGNIRIARILHQKMIPAKTDFDS